MIHKMDIALRTYTTDDMLEKLNAGKEKTNRNKKRLWYEKWNNFILVFDTETTVDINQSLKFGVFRFYHSVNDNNYELLKEGIFYDDRNITAEEYRILQDYCKQHKWGDIESDKNNDNAELWFIPLNKFIRNGIRYIYEYDGILVGFNLPFDISRIASGYTYPKKGYYDNGFIFHLSEYTDKKTDENKKCPFTPRIAIKNIGMQMTLNDFMKPIKWHKGKTKGYCLDLSQFVKVLSGKSHSLKSACKAYDIKHGKMEIEEHGKITPEYIEYCRRDVLATSELYFKLIEEYHHHPIPTLPNKVYSNASMGKGYLQAMNVNIPKIEIDETLLINEDQLYGRLMSAFYAGRTECRIRKIEIPIIYADFKSMYPTVNILMNMWEYLTAEKIMVFDDTDHLINFVESITIDDLFNKKTWLKLPALLKIKPNKDFLPTRHSANNRVVWGYVTSDEPLWYALPDILASKLITGKTPEILQGIGFSPNGKQEKMRPVMLANKIPVNPFKDDFFKLLIEERERFKKHEDVTAEEKERINMTLKLLANSTSYGITIELNRKNKKKNNRVNVYSNDKFQSFIKWYEEPGKYFFPIMGVITTSASHLMLALAQVLVKKAGGIYAMMDTDSIAIVANEDAFTMYYRYENQKYAIPVISKYTAFHIIEKFTSLNPYAKDAVKGSILKVESENYPPDENPITIQAHTKQIGYLDKNFIGLGDNLFGYFIASKRYALYNKNDLYYSLRKGTEIALGALMSPDGNRKWIDEVWLKIISENDYKNYQYAELPALRKLAIRTKTTMENMMEYNVLDDGSLKPYNDSLKPFNFIVSAQMNKLPLLSRVRDGASYLMANNRLMVAPFTSPDKTEDMLFIDIHDPDYCINISTDENFDLGTHLLVKSYADTLSDFFYAPESKFNEVSGETCQPRYIGLLFHPEITINKITYIGKEGGLLEDDDTNFLLPHEDRYTVYNPSLQDEWEKLFLPELNNYRTSYDCQIVRNIV
jgi:hypothetical protein